MERRGTKATVGLATGTLFLLAGCGTAETGDEASSYPESPVTMVVPFSAGGPSDTTGRVVAECLGEELDQSFAVENQPGAAGTVGTGNVVDADPDGLTLGLVSSSTAVAGPIFQDDVQFDRNDLQLIAMLTDTPSVIAVAPDSPYETIDELVTAAEEDPGAVTMAIPGATTVYGIELDRWSELYDVSFQAVPYDGGSEARNAVLSGEADAVWDAATQDLVSSIDNGEYRALATGAEEPTDTLEAPALAEVGYPELIYSASQFSLAAPAGTSEEVVSTLETSVADCQETSEYVDVVNENYIPDPFVGGEDLQQHYDAVAEAWEA